MSYVLLFPLIVMLSRALRPYSDMYNPSIVWIPSKITFENFSYALKALGGWSSIYKTLRIVFVSTLLTMVSCSMAGYGLARYRIKAVPFLTAIAVFTFIVPIQTYVIPIFIQFRFFDFFGIGSLIGLFTGEKLVVNLTSSEAIYYILNILGSGTRSGLFILVFMQTFKGIPQELEDASRVDGSGEFRTFFQIMLPNAVPGFIVTFVMSMVWQWNDYFFPSVVYRQDFFLSKNMMQLRVLATKALGLNSYATNLSETVVMFAGCFIYIAPLLLMYMVAQRYFLQSVERTGITG
ncbi:MAG: carbohydrate ABC transporter permease [Oscillospiraceae bacterium]|nr:carbohydrate ABC transporter permease [Oscillospiraceae bacterium]MDD4545706.1 carbohydrate ABC transporter permease [Oscillospiraceae bacterium]